MRVSLGCVRLVELWVHGATERHHIASLSYLIAWMLWEVVICLWLGGSIQRVFTTEKATLLWPGWSLMLLDEGSESFRSDLELIISGLTHNRWVILRVNSVILNGLTAILIKFLAICLSITNRQFSRHGKRIVECIPCLYGYLMVPIWVLDRRCGLSLDRFQLLWSDTNSLVLILNQHSILEYVCVYFRSRIWRCNVCMGVGRIVLPTKLYCFCCTRL